VLLGLDLGTTAVKAVVLDPQRGIVASDSLRNEPASPHAGWSEQDAGAWLANALALIPRVCAVAGIRTDAITGLGVAGCVPCVLLLDADDEPLRPALLYNDARAHAEIDELSAELDPREVLRRTGAGVTQQSVGPKLRWLQRHEPATWARTARIAGSYDWVAGYRADAAFSERNWALESGLYDLDDDDYASDLCAAAGIDRSMLGPIRDPRQVIGGVSGDVADQTGLRAGIPVVAGLADHVSSAFAAGLAEHGDLLVKLGGSVDVLACSDRPLLDARLYLDAHPSPGLWLPNGCMASGGSGVRWFQRELAAGARLDVLDTEAAETPPGAAGIVMLPYLLGEKTPLNDPLATGAIVGLSAAHGRGHVFRAVLESFAYGVRHHLEVLAEHGVRPARARVTNGGASSALWKQIVADVTGLVLEPVLDHPGSALGAAYAAGMGTGAFAEWSEIGRFVTLGKPILPRPQTAAVYAARYRAYRELYAALRGAEGSSR
jgi:xylulokinase